MIGPNTFRAAVVAPPGESPVQFGYWCPWCETSHAHGLAGTTAAEAIGGTESRVAHCDQYLSPLAGRNVDLTIDRVVSSWDHLTPPGPYVPWSGGPLKTRLTVNQLLDGGYLGLALMRLVFGKRRPASGFDARLVGGFASVGPMASWWFVRNDERRNLAHGNGLGALLSRLFGVPIGVVFVRAGVDALGLDLPPDYRVAIAALVDRAAAGLPLPAVDEETPK